MRKKEMDNILLRYLDGEQMSEDEKAEIERLLADNNENKARFELLKKISEKKRFLDQFGKVDTDKIWTRFQQSVKRYSRDISGYYSGQRKMVYLTGIAAAVLLLISTSAILYFTRYKDTNRIQQVSSMQESIEMELSDGSTIVLNKGSVLSFPEHLNWRRREVNLIGEAYFEIEKKDASPFYVYLKNTTIKVLGTSFNIKAEEDGQVIVNVITGKVHFFKTGEEDNSVLLEAGQKGIFSSISKKFEKDTYNSENFLYWKTGKLSFEDQSLTLVFQDLEDNFNTKIIVEDQRILQNRLTSSCEGQDLDDILYELSILFKIQYYKKGNTIYIQSGH